MRCLVSFVSTDVNVPETMWPSWNFLRQFWRYETTATGEIRVRREMEGVDSPGRCSRSYRLKKCEHPNPADKFAQRTSGSILILTPLSVTEARAPLIRSSLQTFGTVT